MSSKLKQASLLIEDIIDTIADRLIYPDRVWPSDEFFYEKIGDSLLVVLDLIKEAQKNK